MAIQKYSITDTKAYSFPIPAQGQKMYWDSKQAGLGLRVTSTGARSWIVQGYVNGKSTRFTLGKLDDLSYMEARDEASVERNKMRKGINPLAHKRNQQKASIAESITLREVMEDYIQHRSIRRNGDEKSKLRPSTKKGYRLCVEKEFSNWADKPIASITYDAVKKRFEELSKSAPHQTDLVFRYLRALINWAKINNDAPDGSYKILPFNPVSQALGGKGKTQWNGQKSRKDRIPTDKIGEVWLMLERASNPDGNIATTCTSADLISFLILTGCRISEASQLTWSRVKLKEDIPVFKLDITKNHRPITLPISDALMVVLRRRLDAKQKGNPFVFPAVRGKKGYLFDSRAMMKRVSEVAGKPLSNHDMRRTFVDIANKAGVDSDMRRVLLNHASRDVHDEHYNNNPDPELLLDDVQNIGNWILAQSELEVIKVSSQYHNVFAIK